MSGAAPTRAGPTRRLQLLRALLGAALMLPQAGCSCWFFCFEDSDGGWSDPADAWVGERNLERECGGNYIDEACYWRAPGCYIDPDRCAWVRRPGPYDAGADAGDAAPDAPAPRDAARRDLDSAARPADAASADSATAADLRGAAADR